MDRIKELILCFLFGVAVTFVLVCTFPSLIIEEISTYKKLEPKIRIIDKDSLYVYELN